MACKKLSCCDKLLIASIVVGFTLALIMGFTVLRKDLYNRRMYIFEEGVDGGRQVDHRFHQMGLNADNFDEVDCNVEEIEESNEDVECAVNNRGEWCDIRQVEPLLQRGIEALRDTLNLGEEPTRRKRWDHHSRNEEDGRMGSPEADRLDRLEKEEMRRREAHEGRALEPHRQGRHHRFRCMRMRVSFRERLSQLLRRAQAYENMTTLMNFPGCSFSRCEGEEEDNRAQLEETRQEWMVHRDENLPARCFVNKHNPQQVILMSHELQYRKFFSRSLGFHLTFWTLAFAAVCAIVLLVRRCCCSKAVAAENPPIKKNNGANNKNAYIVESPRVSEKEREAFGLPPTENADAPPKTDFLVLVPPSYNEAILARPLAALMVAPPQYVVDENRYALPEKMNALPEGANIPDVQ